MAAGWEVETVREAAAGPVVGLEVEAAREAAAGSEAVARRLESSSSRTPTSLPSVPR